MIYRLGCCPLLIFLLLHVVWLIAASAETYETWIASHSLTGDAAAMTADPDGDRAPNLLEYALHDMDPTEPDAAGHPSMPVQGWLRRVGDQQGDWEWVAYADRATGEGGVWHLGLRWVARPDVEGIKYDPQLSDRDTLERWFRGRSAWIINQLPGQIVQAGSRVQAQRKTAAFWRLAVTTSTGDPYEGIDVGGQPSASLVLTEPVTELRNITADSYEDIVVDDLNVRRYTGSMASTDVRWYYQQSPFNPTAATVTRTSDNEGILTPHATDRYLWTWQGNGTTTIRMSTETSHYERTVTTTTTGGNVVDEMLSVLSGSLRSHLIEQIESRIAGETPAPAKPLFSTQNDATSTYARNTGSWVADVDLTCVSVWNNAVGRQAAGTLVSPRHIICADHWKPLPGFVVRFVTAGNVVVTRTITGMISLANDIAVGVLDSDVPGTITFAKVLPATWEDYLPTLGYGRPVPAIATDQEKKAFLTDLAALGMTTDKRATFTVPTDATRLLWHEELVVGDSGSPGFLLVNGAPVLLCCWTNGGAGTGGNITAYLTEINAAMTTLGGGYQLTPVDLSGVTDFSE